ncbi:MAG TPA: tetratricopeptide repeat protein [Methylomirabilota bacterium]|nr:tetratricopeptide repeat protein [Methylomirabilota bacterium]
MRPSAVWLLMLAVLISACATRLPPIGAGGQPFVPAEGERALWAQAQKESEALLQRVRAYDDPSLSKYLTLMAERLTPEVARTLGGPAWRIEVLRDPTLSAFAMPDGRLFVHSGLLAAVASEAQLALVLGRAVAQVTHRHALAAARDGRLGSLQHAGVTPLSPTAAAILGRSLPLAAAASITGYGARREREADAVALAALVRAGWDPADATGVWGLLVGEDRGPLETFQLGRPAWLRERSESTRRVLDRSGTVVAPGAVRTTEEFEALRRAVTRDNAAEDIRQGRFALARRTLERVLAAAPTDALAHSCYGDLHRLQAQQAQSPGERASAARQAEARYARAIALDPALAEPHRQLGLLHYERGDLARARTELEQYLALAPGAPDARRVAEYVQELGR